MSSKDNYTAKRQFKAIKSRGKRHSSTIAGSSLGIFPEPLVGPGAEHERHPGKKRRQVHGLLEDMAISIDLDVKDVSHNDDFLKTLAAIVGLDRVEKDFEVLGTAEKIIRALAKAKFRNVVTIDIDGDVLYHQPDDFFDVSDAIERLVGELHKSEREGNDITMELISKDHGKCRAKVKVSRIHQKWVHDILITLSGQLSEKYFRRVMNYLEDHLDIEDMEDSWKKA